MAVFGSQSTRENAIQIGYLLVVSLKVHEPFVFTIVIGYYYCFRRQSPAFEQKFCTEGFFQDWIGQISLQLQQAGLLIKSASNVIL